MTQLRLFVAINLPQHIRCILDEVQQNLRPLLPEIRWVKAENLHLTLEFIGEVNVKQLPVIEEVLMEAARGFSPFHLSLQGLGAFPNLHKPRVIWMGLAGNLTRVKKIHDQIHQALLDEGFILDSKPFRPHLTLGRVKQDRSCYSGFKKERIDKKVKKWISVYETNLLSFEVNKIDLMQSVLTRKGPIYSVQRSFC